MNKKIYLVIFLIEGVVAWMLLNSKITIPCFFKTVTHIPCPGCGMTRAFIQIMKFNFVKAFQYNILSIPLFFIILVFDFFMIYDLIKKTNKVQLFGNKLLNYSILFLFLTIISWIVNIVRGI